jgi:predicted AAA+ superfamily ATPase
LKNISTFRYATIPYSIYGDVVRKELEQLIRVTYASNKEEIKEREITALLKAGKEFGCNDLLVITWEYEAEEVMDGIDVVYTPLWKWLVEK